MDFSKIEQTFSYWAKSVGLIIQTEYKGEEVRSTEIIDGSNQKWQLWLVPAKESEECVIHYWNYNDISRHAKVDNSDLLPKLTEIGNDIQNGTVPRARLP